MFTQCTGCGTWFRVSQESLHAVHGLVRCGSCGVVFSALGTLCPEPPEAARGGKEAGVEEPASGPAVAETFNWAEPVRLQDFPGQNRFPWIWRGAAILLILVFAAQIVHAERYTLARWPLVGGAVTAVYEAVGRPLLREPTLAEYRIEDAALTGAGGSGTGLELSGLLRNRAPRAQPLPLLDLKLMNRYGRTVATRLLAPPEYGAGSRTQLGPDLGIAFDVKLADPGATAVGFALALCKRSDDGVRCEPF